MPSILHTFLFASLEKKIYKFIYITLYIKTVGYEIFLPFNINDILFLLSSTNVLVDHFFLLNLHQRLHASLYDRNIYHLNEYKSH
jgi:hypothetical protein